MLESIYSVATVLANSAATLGLDESHEISTIRLVIEGLMFTLAEATASSTEGGLGGLRCSTLRQAEVRLESGTRDARSTVLIFLTTRCISVRLCIARTCVWIS